MKQFQLKIVTSTIVFLLAATPAALLAETDAKPNLAGPAVETPDRPARGQGFGTDRQRPAPMQQMLEGLSLTDEQKEQVRAITAQSMAARRAFREQNGEKIQALQKQIQEAREAKNAEAGRTAAQELRTIMEQGPKPGDVADQVRAVLTPEQQATLDQRVTEARAKMAAERGNRGQGMGGEARPMGRGEGRGAPAAAGEGRPERRGPAAAGEGRAERRGPAEGKGPANTSGERGEKPRGKKQLDM